MPSPSRVVPCLPIGRSRNFLVTFEVESVRVLLGSGGGQQETFNAVSPQSIPISLVVHDELDADIPQVLLGLIDTSLDETRGEEFGMFGARKILPSVHSCFLFHDFFVHGAVVDFSSVSYSFTSNPICSKKVSGSKISPSSNISFLISMSTNKMKHQRSSKVTPRRVSKTCFRIRKRRGVVSSLRASCRPLMFS